MLILDGIFDAAYPFLSFLLSLYSQVVIYLFYTFFELFIYMMGSILLF